MVKLFNKEHIVIVRTGGSIINLSSYNCQELGLAKALTKKGFKVSIILAGTENKTEVIQNNDNNINVYYLKYYHINQALSWFDNIEELLSKLNPTHLQIHEFGMLMSFRVLLWAKKHNIKISLIQGSYQTTNKPFFKQLEQLFNQTLGRYIINNVDGIGCKSFMAKKYVKRYGNNTIFNTFIGLDINKFQNNISKNWTDILPIENKKVLLYIGTLESRRNPLFLIQILQQLPSNYTLLIVGDGPLRNEVNNEIQKYKLEDRCIMMGKLKQEELPSIYKLADLFLLASNYEIYGMVILEALYFSVPVVSTFTAGSEVLIKNNINGAIINNLNVKEWCEKIESFCNDSDLMQNMKLNSSNIINNELTWDKAVDAFIKLYNYENNSCK